jgi:ribosomal protein S6--L-glutamate ligase
MKIAIPSRKKILYSTRRLVEAAQQRGHAVHVIDTLRCYMNIAAHRPEIHYCGENLTGFGAVIPRIGASITFWCRNSSRRPAWTSCAPITARW